MGLLKTLITIFGDSADELKKSYEVTKKEVLEELEFKSSKSLTPRRNNSGDVRKQAIAKKQNTGMKELEPPKRLWWVNDLELLYDGDKYALKYTGKETKTTQYIYDDVDLLNDYQARVAQKQADGSMRYGIACTCYSFSLTDCEYTKVTFLDGRGAVLAIDEDGDEYAIDRWGKSYALEVYKDTAISEMEEE